MTKTVTVEDRFQSAYTYELTEPMGKNFDAEFKPELTPQEMLEIGVFGGNYFYGSGALDEYPKAWFTNAKLSKDETYDKELNYFKIKASKPRAYWIEKGWIKDQDPRGWFQWYCRYYMGRRSEDDERQIKRWKMMKRHIAQVIKNCEPEDEGCRPRQKQALLHWAYDARKY